MSIFHLIRTSTNLKTSQMSLIESIQQSIALFDYTSAQFLAERLHAQQNNISNTSLLARIHYLKGEIKISMGLLDPTCSDYQTLYLFGLCCLDLEKFQDGEAVIKRCIDLEGPNPVQLSAAWCLLGK